MNEKYLPLGTVVLLKGGKRMLMVIGFAGISNETDDKIFDYIGVLYPEGLMISTRNFLFNHEQIEKVIFEGYSSEEDKEYKEKLKKLVSEKLSEMQNMSTNNSNILEI